MSDNAFLPPYIRTSAALDVTPVLGAFRASGVWPPTGAPLMVEDPPEGMLPLTFWVDRHPVASHWYPVGVYQAIRESPFFAEPLGLAFGAIYPRETPGWMSCNVSAVGLSDGQVQALLHLGDIKPIGAPLVHPGLGRVALLLGYHWLSIPDPLRRALVTESDEAREWAADMAERAFSWILYGDPEEQAARLLASIPGIRGEVVEG